MQIMTITGLAFAGIAAAAAMSGAAYAGSDDGTASVVRIVTEDGSVRTVTSDDGAGGLIARWDCPEKGRRRPERVRCADHTGAAGHGAAGRSAGVAVTATL